MSEFLGAYGFIILIAVLMLGCHLLHLRGHGGAHGRGGRGMPPDGGSGNRH